MTQTLTDFIGKLERIGSGSFMSEVKRQAAIDGLGVIAYGYRNSVDPYGATWQPLKYRDGRPLVLTGAFRDTWMAYPTPNGVRFASGVDYGAYHQYGTRSIPFRRVIPMAFYGMPKRWTEVISRAFSSQVRRAVA